MSAADVLLGSPHHWVTVGTEHHPKSLCFWVLWWLRAAFLGFSWTVKPIRVQGCWQCGSVGIRLEQRQGNRKSQMGGKD